MRLGFSEIAELISIASLLGVASGCSSSSADGPRADGDGASTGLPGGGNNFGGAGNVNGGVSASGATSTGGVASGGVASGGAATGGMSTAGTGGGPVKLPPGNRCELAGVTVAKGTTLLVDDVEDDNLQVLPADGRDASWFESHDTTADAKVSFEVEATAPGAPGTTKAMHYRVSGLDG